MIHPNVCFLILLICCWVVTASLMAEKTNVGVAVFVAGNTYMCGFGSDAAAALLSACSLVRCCSHQFVFPCLEVLLQGTPPPCTISCKALPGHSVDVFIHSSFRFCVYPSSDLLVSVSTWLKLSMFISCSSCSTWKRFFNSSLKAFSVL